MKDKIIDKAKEMILENGIKKVTMDDIAKELGISKKTLYENFENKCQLIKEIILSEYEKVKLKLLNINTDNAIERMISVNNFLVEMKKQMPSHIKSDLIKYYSELYNEQKEISDKIMLESIIENLELGKKQGLVRQNILSDVIALVQLERANVLDDIIIKLNHYETETIIREIFEYHIRGICTKKGIEFYENYKNNIK